MVDVIGMFWGNFREKQRKEKSGKIKWKEEKGKYFREIFYGFEGKFH